MCGDRVDDSLALPLVSQYGWSVAEGGEARPDPVMPERKRYWDGKSWTKHVTDADGEQYSEPYLGKDHVRWQYGVVGIGSFRTLELMRAVLGHLGAEGWELVTVYDKAANWLQGYEQGFVLMKRPVPPGARLDENEWCIAVRL